MLAEKFSGALDVFKTKAPTLIGVDVASTSIKLVELSEAGGVRLRPWSIRYSTPAQLDDYGRAAGFALDQRWESFGRTPFDDESARHVSVYRWG